MKRRQFIRELVQAGCHLLRVVTYCGMANGTIFIEIQQMDGKLQFRAIAKSKTAFVN